MWNYENKIEALMQKGYSFTGNSLTNEQFLDHLQTINFHFEVGVIKRENMPEAAISRIRTQFRFLGYGGAIKGLDMKSETYKEDFKKLVKNAVLSCGYRY